MYYIVFSIFLLITLAIWLVFRTISFTECEYSFHNHFLSRLARLVLLIAAIVFLFLGIFDPNTTLIKPSPYDSAIMDCDKTTGNCYIKYRLDWLWFYYNKKDKNEKPTPNQSDIHPE